ncbi:MULTISPECIES: oligosaccharide flippase family protein [Bifidobacterium]|uniref:oligosaccharide flippase family protein n=1 Tax=Bifidobacterium TaxID=1678 RepID=UPI001BDD2B19|nr:MULTISPECIES: oligosaccharide flippase family protein [Bifidobacterium]MBT1162620.1 oligosaccharide flippase family protein [Bifidobacterium sp. SO1]MBW3079765.1 oligosaccharide flippase family protein [Bifidobacterium simiiventris]
MGDRKRILKNSLFLYALTFSNYFIGLLLFPYLSRVLSVEKFGLIGFSTSLCLVFQMIVEFGFQLSTTAEISVHREEDRVVSQLISSMTAAKGVLAVVSTVAFVICVAFNENLRQHMLLVSLFYVDSIAKAFLPDAYFRGIEQMRAITIRAVTAKSGILVTTLLFVKNDSGLILYPLSMIVFDTIALIWAFSLIRKDEIRFVIVSVADILAAIKRSFWFFISRVSVSINGSLGAIFLGVKFLPESIEMGLFSGATKISTAGEQMIPPIGDSLYPFMVRKKDYSMFYKVLLFGGLFWFAGCSFVFVFADQFCSIILGNNYATAGQYLRILVIGVFFGFFGFMFGYPALSPLGKATYANAAIMVSAIINLIACLILWATDNISVLSVSIVFGSSDIVVFLFRFIAFLKFKKSIKESLSNLGEKRR